MPANVLEKTCMHLQKSLLKDTKNLAVAREVSDVEMELCDSFTHLNWDEMETVISHPMSTKYFY